MELERVVYPSIAVQARVEGSVVVKVRINAEGVAAPDQTPQIEGHPLLTSTVRDALPNVRWRGCPSGEQTLKFQFNVAESMCRGAAGIQTTSSRGLRRHESRTAAALSPCASKETRTQILSVQDPPLLQQPRVTFVGM